MRAVRVLLLVLIVCLGSARLVYPVESMASQQGGYSYLPMVMTFHEQVKILPNHTSYVTDWGSVHIVGEVWNRTAYHMKSVEVTATLYDRFGRYLGSQSAQTYLDHLPSGYSTCFDVTFLTPPGGLDPDHYYYNLQPATYSLKGQPLPALSVHNVDSGYDGRSGTFHIRGEVRNDADGRVECVRPVGTLYNRSGRVIGCEVTTVEGHHLKQGESKPFELLFDDRDYADGASYWLQVCGIQ